MLSPRDGDGVWLENYSDDFFVFNLHSDKCNKSLCKSNLFGYSFLPSQRNFNLVRKVLTEKRR